MPEIHETWLPFKQFSRMSHQDLREASDLTVEDAVMHHSNMIHNVVTGLQEALQQDQSQTETPTVVHAPVDHVANAVKKNRQQLATQLQKMQSMMQAM